MMFQEEEEVVIPPIKNIRNKLTEFESRVPVWGLTVFTVDGYILAHRLFYNKMPENVEMAVSSMSAGLITISEDFIRLVDPEKKFRQVMVEADELTPKAITDAMQNGNFYASSGVFLEELIITDDYMKIAIDDIKTTDEIFNENMRGKTTTNTSNEVSIEFIGDSGKVLKTINSPSATYYFDKTQKYTRAKIIFRRTKVLILLV